MHPPARPNPADLDAILDELRREVEEARRVNRACMKRLAMLWPVAMAVFAASWCLPKTAAGAASLLRSATMVLVFSASWQWASKRYERAEVHARLVKALRDEVRAAGPMAEMAAALQPEAVGDVLHNILPALLLRVRASDAPLFTLEQKAALAALAQGGGEWLALAALSALEQVGGEGQVPAVEALARRGRRKVRRAARECLPALRERARLQEASLLRPAGPEGATSGTLLHPATHTEGAAPEELLRAGTAE